MFKLSIILLLLISSHSQALVIADKNSIPERIQRAQAWPFAHVGDIGGGVPIHNNWVLTAAHVAHVARIESTQVHINGQSYAIKNIHIHPQFKMTEYGIQHDIALIELTTEFKGQTALISKNKPTKQSPVVIIGRGDLVTLDNGLIQRNDRVMLAENRVHLTDNQTIQIRLDRSASSLEGMGAPGDSGGPMFFAAAIPPMLVGISSHDIGFGEDLGHATFGDLDVYTDVSGYQDWIQSTTGPQ